MATTTYSRLFGNRFETDTEAKKARDAAYWEAKKANKKAFRGVMKGQLRQYWEFGVPCGQVCDCYELTID